MQFENPQEKKKKRRLLIAALAVGALLLCCICAAVFGFLELDLNIEPISDPPPGATETRPTPDASTGNGGYVPPASVVDAEEGLSTVTVYVRIPTNGLAYLSNAMLEGQTCTQESLNTAQIALREADYDARNVTVRLEFPRPRVEPSPSWTMILGDYEQQLEVYP